ncbi:MAG: Topoisomerase DNA binding C4 zinc finger domain protein [Parcubacteria group bacterium GW2011_GWC1_42_11]|uniref:Topoisomerase DNA binding C4 zinc finger domain protein n=1 Tax=Candidatus Nomurabacteria bacterium GW2011_GWC2_42_20 TaxID=1618756 RepID=A0A0G0ZHG3_9BACT|nr:MAG: Topoisomerase DNA binding C4 zinc finger domain protein [Parcubacteria group bacterium GW2011_GWC1_42_11]KKS48094.1 MAG: Topoisomerase DNA binding C4 zinc finger domain protein [Candidatus Nomurabacteria bacterium GW2011_GWC2_42_20]KKS58233.1 MAG: Topoisomerase DNA binding C4 zinc finger domain protein [Candidatus Nomurabacteria bacterium GW2011_GWA2_42_41]KKT09634.1 MAG: Topoisomerase DNA binding C4 zinc finger domain protein [Candidatus Nomurabacteria bacterium GW2011_GWB1_43_20]TAN36
MNNLVIFAVIVAVVGFVVGELTRKGGRVNEKDEWLPYSKKTWLLTRAEREFLSVLERAVDGKYYIFPQLALDKIVMLEGKGSLRGGYRNKIDQKSVDFVLFDKQNISPVLVIELDDYTHQRPERQVRDGFVDRVLNQCGIPILHITSIPKEMDLKTQIDSKITP